MSSEGPIRLQKFLARCGVASRRACEELINAGRVSVNGVLVTELGTKIDPAADVVAVDGTEVSLPDEAVVLALNKPVGFLTTMDDPQGRETVASLVPTDRYPGLFPVGRLDGDTSGLLLFTNNGELCNNLIHPRKHVEKTYLALVEGIPDDAALDQLQKGVLLEDGPTLPARARLLGRSAAQKQAQALGWQQGPRQRIVKLTITEGRNRQVRRMLASVGHPVRQLHRVRVGSLELGGLPCGQWRLLTEEETAALEALATDC